MNNHDGAASLVRSDALLALLRAERDWSAANIIHEQEREHAKQVAWNQGYLYAVEHIIRCLCASLKANARLDRQEEA